jgi:transcriptional regulator with XRE-family HTH domain
MFDTSRALADMASQVRACRASEGLTLQQLATRSGVAASTIHKVEAQQMVPTVSVLLKISKGLGCRPEQLIRDRIEDPAAPNGMGAGAPAASDQAHSNQPQAAAALGSPPGPLARPSCKPEVGVWQINLSTDRAFPSVDLDPRQRAIILVQQGEVDLQAGDQQVHMDAGDCIEIEGGTIYSRSAQLGPASVMLIVSPAGSLRALLGEPQSSSPVIL